MKILFFTDTHIRGNNPSNRLDIFTESLEEKLREVGEIIIEENIDFVLHGGDLFDRPDVSVSIVNKFVKILQSYDKPIYLISGNHDIYGHNPKTVDRTVISLLDTLGIIRLIDPEEYILLEKNGQKVQLTGQPYIFGIDGPDKEEYYSPKSILEDIDLSIHMVHGLLLEKDFIKTVDHTLIDQIKNTKADIVLAGHYHTGFGNIEVNGKHFINPGSIARITNSLQELNRIPRVTIIEIKDNLNIRFRDLKSSKNGEDVLDREKIENAVYKGEKIYEFQQIIESTLDFERMDINEVLMEVSSLSKFPEEVRKEALRRIALIQMREVGESSDI